MAEPAKGQKKLKALKMFADEFDCSPHYLEEKRKRIGDLYRVEHWYSFSIHHRVRHKADNGRSYTLLIIEWDVRNKPMECQFAVFYDPMGRERMERPYERHINKLGWQEGSRRFYARREKYRSYTWRDTANWVMVAAADLIVPDYCEEAPPDWNWRSIYRLD